jgi:hypothetical protein
MKDERAAEAVAHLQRAALELIEAARAVLDVAEDLVKDPAQLVAMAATVGETATAVAHAVSPEPRQPDEEPRVQRIRVS